MEMLGQTFFFTALTFGSRDIEPEVKYQKNGNRP